jgi:hypothetical protein
LHVDALASKLADLRFSKGVIVGRNGFQSGAIEKAKRIGIDLLSFVEAKAAVHNLDVNTPFLHLAMNLSELSLVFDVAPDFNPPLLSLTAEPSMEERIMSFAAEYLKPDYRCLSGVGAKRILAHEPLTFKSETKLINGRITSTVHNLSNIHAYATFTTRAYLGKLSEVSSFYIAKNMNAGQEAAYIPPEAISKLDRNLSYFGDSGEVPRYLFEGGFVSYSIESSEQFMRRGLFEFRHSRIPFRSRYSALSEPSGKWLFVFAAEDIY